MATFTEFETARTHPAGLVANEVELSRLGDLKEILNESITFVLFERIPYSN